MQAIWLEDRQLSCRRDIPVPAPGPGEARVRVLRAGICNTDLELTRGYYPFTGIPGHEFVGIAEAGDTPLLGRRVVGEINAACGVCATCRAGRSRHCPERTVLGIAERNGAFADYLVLPAANLHAVPDTVDDDAATFAEPVAAALEIQQQVHLRPDDRVLVVGDGKLGLLIVQTLALTGCDLLLQGHHTERLAAIGLDRVQAVPGGEAPPARAFDVVVECTGNESGLESAAQAVRPGGVLVLKSTYAGRVSVDASSLVVDEISVVGSRCGPFAPALRLLQHGLVRVAPLIAARYSLSAGLEALTRAAQPGVLKVVLTPAGQDRWW